MIGCFLRVQPNAENHPRNNVDCKVLPSRLVPWGGGLNSSQLIHFNDLVCFGDLVELIDKDF